MRHFLIVGNTRVGSTWLQTTFDLMPRVRCRREIKWKMHYQVPLAVHTYVDANSRSMKEAIRSACGLRDARHEHLEAIGSKLKFDPYGYCDLGSIASLQRTIEDDVIVMLLHRTYFDLFRTWKVIGIRHLLNEADAAQLARSDPVLINAIRANNQPIVTRTIDIFHDGQRLDGADVDDKAICYPLEDAIEDLFVLFFNDLLALQATKHVLVRHVLAYRDLAANFSMLARAIGATTGTQPPPDMAANPVTLKIAAENDLQVRPDGLLRGTSRLLQAAFADCLRGLLKPSDLYTPSSDGSAIDFRIPGLGSLLVSGPRLDQLIEICDPPFAGATEQGQAGFWRSKRPLYHPEQVGSV